MDEMARLLLPLCLLALACGSDDRRVAVVPPGDDGGAAGGGGGIFTGGPSVSGSSKPKVVTDIPTATLLSELSGSDAVKLCQAIVKAADSGFDDTRSMRLNCYVFALWYATREDGSLDENLCDFEYEECLRAPVT